MKRYLVTAACLTLAAGAVYAVKLNKEQKRLENCGVVMEEVTVLCRNLENLPFFAAFARS
jgi:hypothetical protein